VFAGNLFVKPANGAGMSQEFDQFKVDEETETQIKNGTFTPEEKRWLNQTGILRIQGYQTNTGKVHKLELDIEKLSQIAFEYDILKEVASSVEIDILEEFRRRDDRTLTTSEIAESTERPKSSISRALTRLTEKDKLTKVQAGVYRY
jgi:hypothetical protein